MIWFSSLVCYSFVNYILSFISVAVVSVTEYRHLSVTFIVVFGIICNACVEHMTFLTSLTRIGFHACC
jgi:hypothetical protein